MNLLLALTYYKENIDEHVCKEYCGDIISTSRNKGFVQYIGDLKDRKFEEHNYITIKVDYKDIIITFLLSSTHTFQGTVYERNYTSPVTYTLNEFLYEQKTPFCKYHVKCSDPANLFETFVLPKLKEYQTVLPSRKNAFENRSKK